MTKSVLELPSDIYRKAEMAEKLQQELEEREILYTQREEEFSQREEEFSQREKEFKLQIAQLEAQLAMKNA